MPVQLTDMIRRIRLVINETTPRYYTDTEITDWINDGLRDIARRTETLFTYDTTLQIPAFIPAAGVIPAYPLPPDIIQMQRVEFIPVGSTTQVYKLEPSSQNEMDQIWGTYQQEQSSYPQYWVTRGFAGGTGRHAFGIQLYPYPSAGGQLNLFYYSLPARLEDPLTIASEYNRYLDMQEGWDDLLVDWGNYHSLIKKQNPQWQQIKAIYDQKLGDMIDKTRRVSDQPTFMQPSLMNGVPYWLYGPEW